MNAANKKLIATERGRIEESSGALEVLLGTLQEKYDDMSEGAQEGDAGQKLAEEIEALESVISSLSDAATALEELE